MPIFLSLMILSGNLLIAFFCGSLGINAADVVSLYILYSILWSVVIFVIVICHIGTEENRKKRIIETLSQVKGNTDGPINHRDRHNIKNIR